MNTIIANFKDLPNYKNKMGEIQMILESCEIGSISRISSFANTWRARHTHFSDYHFCECLEGQIEYYETPDGLNLKPNKFIINKGDIFYTAPTFSHEMIFPCYTIFNCYSKLPRNQENYEKETIRFDYSLKDLYDNWKD